MPFLHCVIKCNYKNSKKCAYITLIAFFQSKYFWIGLDGQMDTLHVRLCLANKKIQRTAKLAGFNVVLRSSDLKIYIASPNPQIYHPSKLGEFGF
jgi:hypothetical protein